MTGGDDMPMRHSLAPVWRRFSRHRVAVVCLALLCAMILAAAFAPLTAPYSPTKPVGAFSDPPSPEHILGTDKIGRDMFSRILYAMRESLLVGFLATAISTALGVLLGLVSGWAGGAVDKAIMGFTDMVMSFPYILLVLVAAAIFEPGLLSIVLILGFVDWPGVARLVRGNVLSLRETNFIKSDITAGMPITRILFSELLPNTIAPVLVYATSVFALSILDEAALSFLGMGIQPPTPSLGNMLNGAESLSVLTGKPWLWVPAGTAIVMLVVCINFVGDALRDALDPRNAD
ncbi:MAG: ABC transporter permease [Clostridiales bacterium]|nr:ABC transporter permease [Clostridiales bacterium]